MIRAFNQFTESITRALHSSAIFDYCHNTINAPFSFDDVLRFQLVYGVSAFDTLIHRLVRIGLVNIFNGTRPPTDKYLTENVSLAVMADIRGATVPPPEYYFEQEIVRRHRHLSFQDPNKISDALAFIWNEPQKWVKIAHEVGQTDATVKTTLKTICARRNSIVHEADIDPFTDSKIPITKSDSEHAVQFLKICGEAIYNLVK